MRQTRTAFTCATVLLGWLMLASLFGVGNGESAKLRGLIVGRTGETLTVKTSDGTSTVVLTDYTKVQKPKGLGLRKTQMSFTALIPGLRISVVGVGDEQGRLVAKSITFSEDDLRAAESIQVGLTPTQEAVGAKQQSIEANKVQIAANRERIGANEKQIAENDQEIKNVSERLSNLTEFDTKVEVNVYVASGSKRISTKDQSSLIELAHNDVNLKGHLIEVKG